MKTVLVCGATGSQSRPVAVELLDAGFRVRVLTRNPEKAADLQARGAQIAHADMADREGLRDAHRGVDAVSLLIPAFLDDPSTGADLANLYLKVAGPERLDGDGMAASFGRGLGRAIRYEALTPTAFGAILGQLFGPGAGEAAERGYEAIARDPDLISPSVDMDAVLEILPVTLTPLEAWVRQHAHAFAPAAGSADAERSPA